MFIKLWEKYFLKKITYLLISFIALFFCLYAVIDYSLHMQELLKKEALSIQKTIFYFLSQFIKRSFLLFPLALLVASIKTLVNSNQKKEIVALQTAGLSTKVILRPFFTIALACTFLTALNMEYILPRAMNYLDDFERIYLKGSSSKKNNSLNTIYLKDHSKIFYQTKGADGDCLIDVIWVVSMDEIWKIKQLDLLNPHPVGHFCDYITRTESYQMTKRSSFQIKEFPEMPFFQNLAPLSAKDIENASLSFLLSFMKNTPSRDLKIAAHSEFYYRVCILLLPFLVILALAPTCLSYKRDWNIFFIYSLALFGFLITYTFLNALFILATGLQKSAIIVILLPFLVLSSILFAIFKKKLS
ncbi:MAG: LptF/LptG family permease [Rhabdochlamydiaceae bacterium]